MGIKTITTGSTSLQCPHFQEHIDAAVQRIQEQERLHPGARWLPLDDFVRRKMDIVFCDECGSKLVEITEEHKHDECDQCGEHVSHSDRFCPHCGGKLR